MFYGCKKHQKWWFITNNHWDMYRLQAVKILVQSFTVCHGKWPCSKPVNLSYGELLNYLRGILFAYLIRAYQQRYFIGQARLYYLLGFISYGVIRLHPEECNFDSGNDDMQTLLLKTTPMGITSHLNNIGIFQAHGILGILGLAWIIFTKLSMPDFKTYLSTHGGFRFVMGVPPVILQS